MAEEKILVVQLRQLGDILLTTPCLRAIKRERPKARLTVLTHGMGRLVLDHCPYLDEHFFYEADWSKRRELKLAKTLRERQFDLVLDFMGNPRSALYTFATGAPERVAWQSARGFLYTKTVPKPADPLYTVQDRFVMMRAAGFQPEDESLVLPWFEAHTRPLMKMIGNDAVFRDASFRVVLSPTHRKPRRRWPLERYARLADRLIREWGAVILWIWGPDEEGVIDEVRALCEEKATVKAPKTSFREMAALVGNCDLFIGNSNGPSHVAVANGTPSMQLHGHTSPRAWSPLTDRQRAIQAPPRRPGADPEIADLSEDAVWAALTAMHPTIQAYVAEQRTKRPRLAWR